MKKVLSIVCSAILVIGLILSTTGCSSRATVQDYIESEAFKTEMATLSEQLESQGISIEVTAKENNLLYSYTLNQELSEEDLELYTQSLEASASTLNTTMKQVYDEMVKVVGEDGNVSVTMEYKDAADTLIASFTYPD